MSTSARAVTPPAREAGVPVRPRPLVPRSWAALAGVVAAALALAVTELLAALVEGAPSLVVSVGSAVIALQPAGAKDVVVAWFGTNDKLALSVAVLIVALALGAAVGVLARTRRDLANAAIGGMALLGFVASLSDPQTSMVLAAVSAGLAALVGIQALGWLLGRAGGAVSVSRGARAATPTPIDPVGRRRFLVSVGGLGVLAIAGGGLGRMLRERKAVQVVATEALIPPAAERAAAIPAGADLGIAGVTPLVMPNDRFYRIDTALLTPSIDVSTWSLRVHGMVDRETTLTFDELVALPLVERYVTIACVSNEVGGNLVGNTKWTGVRLTDVLDIAGVKPGATQIVPRSVDGWTAGFPTSWVTGQERDALIAVKMNDQPLPSAHGYPARLIVPGLYGYVSATKWLAELELTTLESFDAYWVRLGWAKEGPDPHAEPDRRAGLRLERRARRGPRRGYRLGARAGHLGCRDLRRRGSVAGGEARPRDQRPDVGPVAVRLADGRGGVRRARAPGPRDRRHGNAPGRGTITAGTRRRSRLPHDLRLALVSRGPHVRNGRPRESV